MGKRLVGYHAHQVARVPEGLANHHAISDWFGMTVSYASFFWAWSQNQINHVPVILEMQNCDISIKALKELCERERKSL